MFKGFWNIKGKQGVSSYLSFWCDFAEGLGIYPFKKVAKTIKAHWSEIINYIENQVDNGILERVDSKIQLAKKARGYRNN